MGALLDRGLGGQGDLGGAVGGLPGAGGDRCAGVEAVVTELAVQAAGFDLAQGARRPGERQQVTFLAKRGPTGPGAFEEIQVVGAVDALQRRAAKVGGALHGPEVALLDALQNVVGARRHFETGHQLAVDELAAAMVQAVVIGIDRQHVVVLRIHWRGAIFTDCPVLENVANGQKGIDVAKPSVTGQPRKWLGATPLQRWKACRKLAVSLNPNVSAMR